MNDPLPWPDPSPSAARALLDIVVHPVPALSRAVRAPKSAWLPYAVLILASILLVVLYFERVDGSWLVAHILRRVPRAVRPRAAKVLNFPNLFASTLASIVFRTSVGLVIVGAYYYIMLSIAKKETTFFSMLSLATWTAFPSIFAVLAALLVVLFSGPHLGLGALEPTAVANLFHIRPGARLYDAASSFSVFKLWTWGLAVLAFVRFYRYRLDRALALVLVPYLLYYVLILIL